MKAGEGQQEKSEGGEAHHTVHTVRHLLHCLLQLLSQPFHPVALLRNHCLSSLAALVSLQILILV